MRNDILANIDDPKRLEALYRGDKAAFRRAFNALYPEIRDNKAAAFWNERLNHESADISWGSNKELAFVIIASLAAGIAAKAPEYLPVKEEFFYPRNIGFIVFPFLTAYFAWKNALRSARVALIAIVTLAGLVFMNALPGDLDGDASSDTLFLSCIHLPLFLWAVLGFAFVGGERKDLGRRIDFLRYNGDLVVMTTLILIAGALLTGMTVALFSLIGVMIHEFYFEYVVVFGLAASPMVATYVVRKNPQLVNKVSPMIARIFSPLVLVTLSAYLVAIPYSGKDPFNDRDFLLVFNLLLIGVMAIILFSIAETSRTAMGRTGTLMLALLALVTLVVNGVALTAILFRLSEWGITPNRLAVLGGNVLILTNLLIVTYGLFEAVNKGSGIERVERSISVFLPIYSLWTAVVVFVFPIVFGFK